MTYEHEIGRYFDRTHDVSKLTGCNTRNVQYRWDIFEPHLKTVSRDFPVLDFGAGSLRETYELAMRGFEVTAVDLDREVSEFYESKYDWGQAIHRPKLYTGTLSGLLDLVGKGHYGLVLAFDALEHVERPEEILAYFRELLCDDGLLFCTVPNKFTLSEMYFHFLLLMATLARRRLTPGAPHLQFKSCKEWLTVFEDNGFRIVEHDMAIGFFVNTWCNLWAFPLRSIGLMLRELGCHVDATKLEQMFYPEWLVGRINMCDELTKRLLHGLYTWNLIVARKGQIVLAPPKTGQGGPG